ncbi:cyclin-dependent protein kinase complex component [Ophiostoma piceae UAMH 11346]|uniref:Cyclin-dependent protein kinase complex component n=1 Tax=Ophiostoma piceae (strain UAMH 11346) TaxID=1262450 RepID=S3BS81_OPHP1|nr:cyclin-dependent protein kinase complex component [Ophiostoma piceae UAMH 11346]
MATLIGDLYGADPSPFHHVRAASTHQQQTQQQQPAQQPLQHDHPMFPVAQSAHTSQSSQSHSMISQYPASHPASPPLSSSNSFTSPPHQPQQSHQSQPISLQPHQSRPLASEKPVPAVSDGSERIPTPPDSSTPTSPHQQIASQSQTQPTFTRDAPAPSRVAMSSDAPLPVVVPAPEPTPAAAPVQAPAPALVVAIPVQDEPRVQRTIMVRDLAHIQTLTQPEHGPSHSHTFGDGILAGDAPLQDVKFDISAMPIGDIIEMVAALLTKITTTNDHQHDALHRNATHSRQAQAHNDKDGTTSPHSPHSASVLAFHGKNVPAITILSYLSRIHKYCPTTYEVFLSLLVYFDRMTERVNDLVMKQQRVQPPATVSTAPLVAPSPSPTTPATDDVVMSDTSDASDDGATVIVDETDENIADSSSDSSSDDDDDVETRSEGAATTRSVAPNANANANASTSSSSSSRTTSPHMLSATYFVVDSYNIHRLIIAGVTCASKFFSDVFYTNARYAKVGGLPLAELNHLELQFLILNDFRLAIPIEDLDAYATMLVEFYAREVVGQRPRGVV